jgi:hypothetical protein
MSARSDTEPTVAFRVSQVKEVPWDDEAVTNLILPEEQQSLINSLVARYITQPSNRSFDDFVEGKGLGLVFNLHGPAGVGKTLTVEATSARGCRALYTKLRDHNIYSLYFSRFQASIICCWCRRFRHDSQCTRYAFRKGTEALASLERASTHRRSRRFPGGTFTTRTRTKRNGCGFSQTHGVRMLDP